MASPSSDRPFRTREGLLPPPVAPWHATVGARTVDGIAKGDAVLVHGHLVRRFSRSGSVAAFHRVTTAARDHHVDPTSGGDLIGSITTRDVVRIAVPEDPVVPIEAVDVLPTVAPHEQVIVVPSTDVRDGNDVVVLVDA